MNQWRLLTVLNHADTGVRTLCVDGIPVANSAASTAAVPAGTVLTFFPQCAVTLAEIVVWNGADITQGQPGID